MKETLNILSTKQLLIRNNIPSASRSI